MLCIGHRGARGQSPENTLASIALGITQGAQWIEIDVRQHSGELIIIHDEYVDRTTNGLGSLADFSLSQLRQLDAGNGQQIPLLAEVIRLIDRRVKLNIELKDSASNALVLQCIEEFVQQGWQYQDFMISSFIHPDLVWFKQQQPSLAIGALSAGVMVNYAQFAQDLGASAINLCDDSINQTIIDDSHARGLKVFVYTVNDPREFKRFHAMGVDGLFTDYPARLNQWLCDNNKTQSP